ncbi:MAG: hypothetical protein PVF29_07100 [Desulfobacterales bacterium]
MGAATNFDGEQGLDKKKAKSNTYETGTKPTNSHIVFFHFKIKTIGIQASSVYSSLLGFCQKRHTAKSINISYAYIFAFSRRNSVLYIYQRLEHVNSVWHGTIVFSNNIKHSSEARYRIPNIAVISRRPLFA